MGRQELIAPLRDSVVESLRAGDQVQLSGVIYTARDMAHQRLCAQIEAGEPLPFDLKGAVIYFVGPTPARPGQVIGAAGPTTSSRMDAFSPILLAHGIKAMMGKGYRGEEVQQALIKCKAVHFATFGGAGALLARHITKADVVAYDDLGTEAIRRLEVQDFPAVVAYDALGGCVYDR